MAGVKGAPSKWLGQEVTVDGVFISTSKASANGSDDVTITVSIRDDCRPRARSAVRSPRAAKPRSASSSTRSRPRARCPTPSAAVSRSARSSRSGMARGSDYSSGDANSSGDCASQSS